MRGFPLPALLGLGDFYALVRSSWLVRFRYGSAGVLWFHVLLFCAPVSSLTGGKFFGA